MGNAPGFLLREVSVGMTAVSMVFEGKDFMIVSGLFFENPIFII